MLEVHMEHNVSLSLSLVHPWIASPTAIWIPHLGSKHLESSSYGLLTPADTVSISSGIVWFGSGALYRYWTGCCSLLAVIVSSICGVQSHTPAPPSFSMNEVEGELWEKDTAHSYFHTKKLWNFCGTVSPSVFEHSFHFSTIKVLYVM